ncbi:MAG: hypothetical protein E7254_01000 [Lachnospiraceae bacterium]|nr:hypothetical protein [Lachnospiraceae bacterium]
MKKIIKNILRPFYKMYKNGVIGNSIRKKMTPDFELKCVNNKIICNAKSGDKYVYNIIIGEKKYFVGKNGAKLPLDKQTLKAIRNNDFTVTAWGYHLLMNYRGEECGVSFSEDRYIVLNEKEYTISNKKYIDLSFYRKGYDLTLATNLISADKNDDDVRLVLANRAYKVLDKIHVKKNRAIIKNVDAFFEENDLLRLIFISGGKVIKAVAKPFEDDEVQTSFYFDFVNIKKKLRDYSFETPALENPVPAMLKGYKRLNTVEFEANNNSLVLTFKKKYADCKFYLYLKSLKTNDVELVVEKDLKKKIVIDNLDEILDREINLIDRYVLEYEVKNAKGKSVDKNWLKIVKVKTRNIEDYKLMEAHGNRLGFLDNQILVVENQNNHYTYDEVYDFDLTNHTFSTDLEVINDENGNILLDLSIYSLLSKVKKFTIYLEDKYMKESFNLFEKVLDTPKKMIEMKVPVDVEKIKEYLYYNARLNFKIGVEYVGDYKESGFLTKKKGTYSVGDRYLYRLDLEDDLVIAFYIGGNIYNLNVWHTSVDEYMKGVKFQTGREKYFETLKNEDSDENLIFFEANLGKNYTGNPKYLYEYMINHDEYKNFKFVWAYPDVNTDKIPGNPTIVERGSSDYFYYLAKAKYWVNNILFPVKEKRHDTIYLQTWHGTPLKKLGFDIECEGPEKQAFGNLYKESLNWDYFLTDNDYGEEKLVNAFRFKKHVIKKGYPINDIYHVDELKNRAVEKLHKEYPVTEKKQVILYAPTWRDLQGDYVRGYDFSLPFDVEELYQKFSDKYVILVKLHHLIADSLEIDEKYKDFLINVSDKEDVMELLCVTDVLITDYSSVFYDFASAKKPILFYMYDLDEYINETRGLYVGVETLPGPIIEDKSSLVEAIENIQQYTYDNSEKLRDFCRDMAKYCKGTSCKDVLDIVIKKEEA